MSTLGFDFGTTNTVLALRANGKTRPVEFTSSAGRSETVRTCLSFMADRTLGALALKTEAGSAAIETFIANPGTCRFLQSIKTFAANPLFQNTKIFSRSQSFEDLMEVFLRKLMRYAGDEWPTDIDRVVAGRPVRFAGSNPKESLAVKRYNAALSRFGFPKVYFVLEPVAAAFYFAEKLGEDTNVLVADFGGGTSDFSIIRFERIAGRLKATPIAQAGVGIAGDTFDYRIIDNVVGPLIGKGTRFKSFGKMLDVPQSYYASFGQWNQLSIFKTTRDYADLKEIARFAEEPEKIEAFIDLVDHDEGYPLYRAVSATKLALSTDEEAEFFFAPLGESSRRAVRRRDFEQWIADDLAAMEDALDDVLARARLGAGDIDKVFLTGGTSFVPAVREIFRRRFDPSRVEGGDELLSIAQGLSIIGERDDIGAWDA